jgi:hypothetical protein
LWDNERTKRNFNFENKEANDPYKPKDYAEHYKTSTKATSRDEVDAIRRGDRVSKNANFEDPAEFNDFGDKSVK